MNSDPASLPPRSRPALDRLLAWGREHKLNQTELAKRLDVTAAAITNWKKRGGVPLSSLPLIIARTGIAYDELVGSGAPSAASTAPRRQAALPLFKSSAVLSPRSAVLTLGRWVASLESPVLREQAARALHSLGEHPTLASEVADLVERIADQADA